MGRTSRVYELIQRMAQKGVPQGFPTKEQVTKLLQPYEDKIDSMESRIAELEKKLKEKK